MMEELKVVGIAEGIRIDEEISKEIKLQLLKEMDQSTATLQFENYKFITGGWIEINCINKDSVDWLINQDEIFASYSKFNKHKIEFFKITEYTPVTLCIPNYPFKFDTMKARIEQQNPGLKTNQWRYIKEKLYLNSLKEDVRKFLFEVDGETIKYLETKSWKLYLQFGKVSIQKFDDSLVKNDSKREEIPHCVAIGLFNKEDLKGKYFLSDIVNEIEMARWGVVPLKYHSVVLSP